MQLVRNYTFLLLLIVMIFNLNGVVSVFFNIKQAFTFVYLFLAIILFFTSSKIVMAKGFRMSRMVFIFLIIHLFFGTIATFMNDDWINWKLNIRAIIVSIVIVFVLTDFLLREMVKGDLDYWLRIIVNLTVLSALSGIVFKISGIDTYGNYTAGMERMSGFFANPNELGFVVNIALSFMLIRLNEPLKLTNLFFVLLLSLGSILTYSKSSIITSILIWSLYFIMFYYRGTQLKLFIFLSIIIATVFMRGLIIDSIFHLSDLQSKRIFEVFDIFSGNITDESTTGRVSIFIEAYDKIMENPIIGYGLGSFNRMEQHGLGTHNSFLTIFGESGIFPIIFLVFLFGLIISRPWTHNLQANVKFIVLSLGLTSFNYMMGTHGVFQKRIFILYFTIMAIYADGRFMRLLEKQSISKQ